MMTKIFGAALIVSGGFLLGWIPVQQNKQRLQANVEVLKLLTIYDQELREKRLSPEEVFSAGGALGSELLNDCKVKNIRQEERRLILESFEIIRNSSYSDAVKRSSFLLSELNKIIKRLEAGDQTTGKALPLVTGAIGILVAILLF